MVKPPKGYRHRTRHLLRKNIREKGAIPPLSKLMIEYRPGDKVHIVIDPAIHKAMPHRRYHGKTGVVIGKRGRSYIVQIKVGSKIKTLFVRPEHLKPAFSIDERIREIIEDTKKLVELARGTEKLG